MNSAPESPSAVTDAMWAEWARLLRELPDTHYSHAPTGDWETADAVGYEWQAGLALPAPICFPANGVGDSPLHSPVLVWDKFGVYVMCQRCSERAGLPVPLSSNGRTAAFGAANVGPTPAGGTSPDPETIVNLK